MAELCRSLTLCKIFIWGNKIVCICSKQHALGRRNKGRADGSNKDSWFRWTKYLLLFIYKGLGGWGGVIVKLGGWQLKNPDGIQIQLLQVMCELNPVGNDSELEIRPAKICDFKLFPLSGFLKILRKKLSWVISAFVFISNGNGNTLDSLTISS